MESNEATGSTEAGKRQKEEESTGEEIGRRASEGRTTNGNGGGENPSKAPPSNLAVRPKEKEVVVSAPEDDSNPNSSSGESEEHEKMRGGIIDLDTREMQTGAQMGMKNALAEERYILERNRYIEKVRSAQTIKIIVGPGQLEKQFKENIKETTYEALSELKKWDELYIGIIIRHIDQYIWRILDVLPEDDEEVWKISKKHTQ